MAANKMISLNIILISLAFGQLAESSFQDLSTFFNVGTNLTLVTFERGVNSRPTLNAALSGPASMIEADIVLVTYVVNGTNQTGTNITIIPQTYQVVEIGNPLLPNVSSNISLNQFLLEVAVHNALPIGNLTRKGVQLNFANIYVLQAAVLDLLHILPQVTYPVWIHSEILAGPVNPPIFPVPSASFFNLVRGFRNSILAVGWTTTLGTVNNSLTAVHVNNMIQAISNNNVDLPVTFSIRAAIAVQSALQLEALVNSVNGSTLTIWATDFEPVNLISLRNLILNIGINRTFIAIPTQLRDQLDLSPSGAFALLPAPALVFCVMANIVLSLKSA